MTKKKVIRISRRENGNFFRKSPRKFFFVPPNSAPGLRPWVRGWNLADHKAPSYNSQSGITSAWTKQDMKAVLIKTAFDLTNSTKMQKACFGDRANMLRHG